MIREDNESEGKIWTWEYDSAGNILNKKEYAYTTGALGTPTKTTAYGYPSSATGKWNDRLISYDGRNISYDMVGNPLSDGVRTFNWEKGRQLSELTQNGVTWEYTYDANGLRTKKTNTSTQESVEYIYSGGRLRYMCEGWYTLIFEYDANGFPQAVICNDTRYFYITNLQGDVIAIIDEYGCQVAEYEYDAWGNLISWDFDSDTITQYKDIGLYNPLRYRGYVYDRETGLYYLQSRYYNPEWGRFINADNQLDANDPLGLNLFAYCLNNPVMNCDPSGHSAIVVALVVGAVLGGIYGGISAAANDQNVVAGIAIGAVVGGLTGVITEVASVPLMLLGTFAVGVGGDIATQTILEGKSWGDVNLISAGWAGVTNAGLSLLGKGISMIDAMNGLQGSEKIIFNTITNSPLLALSMAINMSVSANANVYTVNDFLGDVIGEQYKLA